MKRPLRIALIGNTVREYSAFVTGVREGIIRLGHRYRGIDFRSMSPEQTWHLLKEFKPDYVFTHMILNASIGKTPQTLDVLAKIRGETGAKIIHTMQDARRTSRYPHDISDSVDMGLLNQTECLEDFEKTWGIPCHYWPYATLYQRAMAEPDPALERFEFVYTGNMNNNLYKERTDFVNAVRKRIKLFVFKTQEDGDKRALTAELAATAKAVFGMGLQYDIDGYIDVRPFQYCGAGALLITHNYKGMEKVFENGKHLVAFEGYDVDNVVQLYSHYRENAEKADRIRRTGFEYVQRCHNWEVRVQDAIDTIEGRRKRPRVFLADWQ